MCCSISHYFQDKCLLHRNSRWQLKIAGKQILRKVASIPWNYPVGQKFHRNCTTSHCFQDKCVFAFYAEIQDGRLKWWENYTLHIPWVSKILSKSLYLTPFHTEIQDDWQKCQESDFGEKLPVDSADTL